MTRTITVRGIRTRTASQRRYVAFRCDRRFNGGQQQYTDVARVEIFKRSDSVATLRTLIQRQGFHSSRFFVVIDTTTGEEV